MSAGPSDPQAPMSPEQWDRIKDLVADALRYAPDERRAFLERACGPDRALRDEVESLLAHETDGARLLKPPDSERMASLLRDQHADAAIGRTFGKFTVKAVLGYGGMGVVYRAEQDQPKRDVALKVMSGGLHASPYQQKLFRREVQSLARLQHNGIAALYETGTDDEGRQFFAMELVEGRPLIEYAREECAGLDEQLRTFVRVCRAIQYAHQRGVIHRDIKPSNIIVREDGWPKVLDFGLAKLVEDVDGGATTTSLGKVHGTISYMSPEQARGGSVALDTRSDVYSLGVVLFEILTNRRPLEVTNVGLREAIDAICHEPPPKLGSLVPALRGDLEIILEKALTKEPERRYQSAEALADDIERFRSHQPIAARRPSAVYHLRKLAARHKVPATLAVLLGLAVSALAIVATVMSLRLAQQRDAAIAAGKRETEARQASDKVAEFLVGLFGHADPGADLESQPSVRDIVDAGAARIHDDLADQPLVQARLMTALGSVYARLSDFESGRKLLERGLQIRREKLGDDDLEVAESLVALGGFCQASNEFDDGYKYLEEALRIRAKAMDSNDPELIDVIDRLGSNRYYSGHFDDAADRFREVLARKLQVYGAETAEVTQAQSNLAAALESAGKLDEAEALLRDTLATQRRVLGDHLQTSFTLDTLVHVMFDKGDAIEAERLEKERVDMLRRIVHENHPTLLHALGNYAFLVNFNHGPEQAEPLCEDVLTRTKKSLGPVSDATAHALLQLGHIEMKQKKHDEAIPHFKEALSIRRELFGPASERVGGAAFTLGQAYRQTKQFDFAEPLLLESYKIFTSESASNPAQAATVAEELAALYTDWGRDADAKAWASKQNHASDSDAD